MFSSSSFSIPCIVQGSTEPNISDRQVAEEMHEDTEELMHSRIRILMTIILQKKPAQEIK